ncbi:MAG: pyridoxamine 5'-phosphate oxidase family protein [Dysgonomonas sp.]|jgi:nitroimidazol reductase NimA-like FMN-containing flavoprotein (pyridoxamine 5'-phosphate oxidase superfamily)|uniref:pyridoxamine 5'-phosphate oxidase family protein n=1 Tax=unclassified Dysgonomonas TaxID=2630389 RepID=UPI0025C2C9D3|nr:MULTISPECIES: pyridoxamine 5'-phosphate oxidase family protein [unclassified Dysgonomonas]MDR1716298.1 pyridoxamine 5'-phosphate oxidase family protein [Prevotella sp.]HMM01507.1 pyridoxamine 5'-phosphate oxidase family protein [Dysgonomonas sp.]
MMTVTVEERTLINEIILKNQICYVGMIDSDGMPYVIPMNFGYQDDIIYLHSAQEGGSIKALAKNPNVCITFCTEPVLTYQNKEVACSYRVKGSSVICRGRVVFEENYEEKIKALDIIMQQYTERKFTYSIPSINNVRIWKIEIESVSTKVFGVPHPNSRNYKDKPEF